MTCKICKFHNSFVIWKNVPAFKSIIYYPNYFLIFPSACQPPQQFGQSRSRRCLNSLDVHQHAVPRVRFRHPNEHGQLHEDFRGSSTRAFSRTSSGPRCGAGRNAHGQLEPFRDRSLRGTSSFSTRWGLNLWICTNDFVFISPFLKVRTKSLIMY